jgi:putative membrane protein
MRPGPLLAGLAALALIWTSPLLGPDRDSFTAHMLAHMGVVAIAAPLIALGLPRLRPPIGAVPASILELAVVWLWHAPALRAAAEVSPAVTALEQATFLAAGVLLWRASLAAGAAGAFALLLTSMHMTLLGALLSLTPRPLYGEGAVSCLGLSLAAGQDQALGGTLMLLIGAGVYLAGGLALMAGELGRGAGRPAS